MTVSSMKSTRTPKRTSPTWRIVLGAAVTLSTAMVAVVVFMSSGWQTDAPETRKAVMQTKTARATSNVVKATGGTRVVTTVGTRVAEKEARPQFEKRPGAMQLPDGRVLTFPAPKRGEIRKVYAYGHMYECDSEGNFVDVTPRRLFNTAFEGNFLALAVEGRTFIPAFLTGLDQKEVKKLLKKDYEPVGDETEEEMAQLRAYDDMRRAALQYMEEGGSFDDFVTDFANYERKSRETNAMCLREVMTLCKEGRIEEAKEMAQAASKLMERKGLRPFRLPAHVRAAFDELD